MVETTVGICESFKSIGIEISEGDLRKFEAALWERGLNVAPRALPWAESVVQIDGRTLTEGQAMTVRVAVTQFHAEMSTDDARRDVGPIADAYRERAGEVLAIMIGKK